jgi:hypothetical protein
MALTKLNNNSLGAVTAASNLALTSSNMPTGSVLQVVQGTTFTGNFSENAGNWTATSVEVSITPSATSSKIMVQFTGAIRCYNTNGHNAQGAWRIYRKIGSGSYAQLDNHQITHRAYDYGGGGLINDIPFHFQYLDDPQTTSTVYYKIYGTKEAGSQIELNPDGQDETYSFATEIKG